MKTFRKTISVILAMMICLACISVSAFAADGNKVGVRVEGITKTLFDGEVTVSGGATALDALEATGLDVVSALSDYGSIYVKSIEGDTEKTFGGWDGWLYEINGDNTVGAMDTETVKGGDSMLVYYGDPYGVGMQYPEVSFADDFSAVTVTSADEVTDWTTYETTTSINPVVGATITIDGKTKLVTDENGVAEIPEELRDGEHGFVIERYAENGLPTALRTAGKFGEEKKSSPFDFILKALDWFRNLFKRIVEFFKGLGK